MIFWRISNYADLTGTGGLFASGRWHNKGVPIVYLSDNPALAMLEVLVHFEMGLDEVPEHYQLLKVEYPSRKSIGRLSESALPQHWQDDLLLSRSIGDEWLTSGKSALLRVPSAVIPEGFNFLLNPRHPLARQAKIVSAHKRPFDQRLF